VRGFCCHFVCLRFYKLRLPGRETPLF
jgi:hypothetical protein